MVNTHCLLCEARNGLFETCWCGIFCARSWVAGRQGMVSCICVRNDSVETVIWKWYNIESHSSVFVFRIIPSTRSDGKARALIAQRHNSVWSHAEHPLFTLWGTEWPIRETLVWYILHTVMGCRKARHGILYFCSKSFCWVVQKKRHGHECHEGMVWSLGASRFIRFYGNKAEWV